MVDNALTAYESRHPSFGLNAQTAGRRRTGELRSCSCSTGVTVIARSILKRVSQIGDARDMSQSQIAKSATHVMTSRRVTSTIRETGTYSYSLRRFIKYSSLTVVAALIYIEHLE
jgi:hypothetical protein